MAAEDYAKWQAYFYLKDTQTEKIDYYFSRLLWMVSSFMGGKAKSPMEFLIYPPENTSEPAKDVESPEVLAFKMNLIASANRPKGDSK